MVGHEDVVAESVSFAVKVIESRGQTLALLEKGRHRLTVSDPAARMEQETWIEVRDR